MILGAHIIFGTYGFWLPNDPRGSWSDFVRAWELLKYGDATKTEERRSVAAQSHNSALRAAAKRDLMYPPVIFTGKQAAAISYGFADVVLRTACVIYACAIMPDHVHLVIGRHRYSIQQVANLLKGGATTSLRKYHLDPMSPFSGLRRAPLGSEPQGRRQSSRGPKGRGHLPSPWAHKFWKVWLDSEDDMHRSIDYVNKNPLKEGLRLQNWKFIASYAR
jgi:REP element-mobilizing transposase RayT